MSQLELSSRDFAALSVRDLLDARDAYHVHLSAKRNVVGTAIGRFRIRKSDEDAAAPAGTGTSGAGAKGKGHRPPRTLANTVVKPWSWPCVLVFVEAWETKDGFRTTPDQMVPYYLFMPDGRVVPTCVVQVEREEGAPAIKGDLRFPTHLIGGGFPILTHVQGSEHVGSIGCLVTDGDTTYALTNRHVTGRAGRNVYTLVGGKPTSLGVADELQVGKRPFSSVFPGWPGTQAFANIDAGLIRIDDLNDWTAQVFGIGEVDLPVDLNTQTLSLNLIGLCVRAFGGASGPLVGAVHALFYRYKSIGGSDYVADLLIGPRDEKTPLTTLPGDSGTTWFLDDDADAPAPARGRAARGARARRARPVALQWGGQVLLDAQGETKFQFALATCLSTICRELDVEVVRDWNIGHSEYWGKLGHYKIAAKACELLPDATLRKFFLANADRIAYGDVAIKAGQLGSAGGGFVPLADVADLVWRDSRKSDENNHFADMDQPGKDAFVGQTLLDICAASGKVDIDVWNDFYQALGEKRRGALPFRVWQGWTLMVKYAKAKDPVSFLCVAGLMAHYVGDACQPLHVSRYHHGRTPAEKPVHSAYETSMLDSHAAEVVDGVNRAVGTQKGKTGTATGHQAALGVVDLMRRTIATLPPEDVCDAFSSAGGRGRQAAMWQALKDRTFRCMADGALTLASLWQSAWDAGDGDKVPAAKLVAVTSGQLSDLYDDADFFVSVSLQDMKSHLEAEDDGAPAETRRASPARRRRPANART